jgi:nucleoid-associated protein YgaU
VHRVTAGDTLWTIAARAVHGHGAAGVTFAWHRLYDANRAAIGADPALLHVGTSLCVPASLSSR